MNNYTKLSLLLGIFLLIFALLIFLPFIFGKHIEKIKIDSEVETNEWFQNRVQKYDIIICEFGLKNSLHGFVYENKFKTITDHHIHFYRTIRDSIFSGNFDVSYTGGTTIKNTTFPELVEMVKEDCSQFQEDYDNPNPETGIDWGYREADPPESPKTEEELEYEKRQNYYTQIRSLKYVFNETFTDFQQAKFIEMFGDVNLMTDEEIYNTKKEIDESGGMAVVFKEYLFDEEGNVIFRN